mmetsp:Transcript_13097/g.33419  ORF Transcript_13097/g.33419 Transcript_13097/m.33419 type:complete len:211 (-) Transcript_13097:1108-1740(-)
MSTWCSLKSLAQKRRNLKMVLAGQTPNLNSSPRNLALRSLRLRSCRAPRFIRYLNSRSSRSSSGGAMSYITHESEATSRAYCGSSCSMVSGAAYSASTSRCRCLRLLRWQKSTAQRSISSRFTHQGRRSKSVSSELMPSVDMNGDGPGIGPAGRGTALEAVSAIPFSGSSSALSSRSSSSSSSSSSFSSRALWLEVLLAVVVWAVVVFAL